MMQKTKVVRKPWGEEHLFAHSKRYAGKILVINKGHRLSLQYHKKKEETLCLLSGLMKLTLVGKNGKLVTRKVETGACFHILPGMVHRMEAVQLCRLVEVSTPELDDVVRIEDDYNRTAKTLRGEL